jgi:hypothetical protein
MKPGSLIRKSAKWGGVFLSIALIVVWIASAWVRLDWRDYAPGSTQTELTALVAYGCVLIEVIDKNWWGQPPTRVFHFSASRPHFAWWGFYRSHQPGFDRFRFPLWTVVAPAIAITCAAWRLDTLARRRARIGHCPACNYDRRGLPAASPCPECGAVPAPSAQTPT